MDTMNSRSEVARLMRQITEEYEAAQRGFTGLAYGTARHDFITRRMENIARCREELEVLVGKQASVVLAAQALEQAED